MNYPLVVVTSLGATLFFALSTALKHRSASTIPTSRGDGLARLANFVQATLRHRWWLAGILADAGGLALQAYALHIGALSVVQPVLMTALLTSLLLTHLVARTRISRGEIGWGAVLVVALATFLSASGTTRPSPHHSNADRGAAVLAGLFAFGLAVVCVVIARRLGSGARAAFIGVAVGTVYACTAVLIKALTNIAAGQGLVAVLTSWQLPTLVVSGAIGLTLAQLAFRSGPLNASLPAIATVDPLLSVTLGITVYDEQMRTNPAAVLAQFGSLAALLVAAIALSRVAAEQQGVADLRRQS